MCQVRTGQVRTGQVRTGQVRTGQVRTGQERAGTFLHLILGMGDERVDDLHNPDYVA